MGEGKEKASAESILMGFAGIFLLLKQAAVWYDLKVMTRPVITKDTLDLPPRSVIKQ